MTIEWKWTDIKLYTVTESEVTSWFRTAVKTQDHFWYESTASNFLAQNPQYIANNPVRIWREQELGTYENRSDQRVDVIIEAEEEVWLIEVKYPIEYTVIFSEGTWKGQGVPEQLYGYRERIEELGWWKGKSLMLGALWIYGDNIRDKKEIAERHHLLK